MLNVEYNIYIHILFKKKKKKKKLFNIFIIKLWSKKYIKYI